jgi:hypothetical protein
MRMGSLDVIPAADRPDLLAPPTLAALVANTLPPAATGIAEIDPGWVSGHLVGISSCGTLRAGSQTRPEAGAQHVAGRVGSSDMPDAISGSP